ncbi:peptidoglycan D,D-transpeptidase FtsI family protein [Marinicrinis lubricantis]|uniref:Peptidoglycan D,D-transpeptidase FtsI family protein n=1 Tax=Marinicrinis lubricantis TaxID=2086470 RepID=A0ABW1IQV4_9BACL
MDKHNEQDAKKKEWLKRRSFGVRLNVFFFCTFILFSILVIRLAILQFVESEDLLALKHKQNVYESPIPPIRGNIYDHNGAELAYSTSTQSLFYRVEQTATAEDWIAMAKKLEQIFKEKGEPGEASMTAAEIMEQMDVGFDLEGNQTTILQRFSEPRRIKTDLSDEELAYFAEHRDQLLGVEIVEESIRHFAMKDEETSIAAQLLGYLRSYSSAAGNTSSVFDRYRKDKEEKQYLSDEEVGFYGIEYMFQDQLRGENGKKIYSVDPLGQIVSDQVEIIPPVKGNNLYLTLDKEVQLAAENAIAEHLIKIKTDPLYRSVNKTGVNATSGYAVAMEVETGKIIAMANFPSYDANVWRGGLSTEDLEKMGNKYQNGTITDVPADYKDDAERAKHPGSLVPLGSTIKPLTVLIGLDQGVITTNTQYFDNGEFYFGADNSRIRNSEQTSYGSMDPSRAIAKSSNTFMAEMIGQPLYKKLGRDKVLDVWDGYMKKFGLGSDTGSGLLGESTGTIEYTNTDVTGSALASMVFSSFGQGGRYTALQLAQFATTLANKGVRLKPQFVEKITTHDGELVEQFKGPEVVDEIEFDERYWEEVLDGMSKVSQQGFDDFPYEFASKTGTSQQNVAGGGVENAIFIAFAPFDDPKLAVAVVVPEGGYGSWGAAPIARQIFDAYDKQIGLTSAKNTKTTE